MTTLGTGNALTCPTTMSVSYAQPFPLPSGNITVPPNFSGIGIVAFMDVGPATQNFFNVQMKETISRTGGTCNTSIPLCNGGSTFYVGYGETQWGTTFPEVPNQFYDNHGIYANYNMLQSFGQSSCTVICSQSYSCGGNVIGSFTITYSLNPGTVNGYAVTQVTAQKTQN